MLLLALACRNDKDPSETGLVHTGLDCVAVEETCNDADDDCDGVVDEEAGELWYLDLDGDGFGDPATEAQACEGPIDAVGNGEDCDDSAVGVFPGATETCDEVDEDCDQVVDEEASDAAIWYQDEDDDGWGTEATVEDCEQPSGYADQTGDCDDGEGDVNPGATEVWYDGTDSDCAGDDDYDADGDGSQSSDWGGEDCLDNDPTVSECRPAADCTRPAMADIEAAQVNGSTDLVFDDACAVYVCGIRSGLDYTFKLESDGTKTVIDGYSNYNQQAIALDPNTGDIVIAHNANAQSTTGMGYVASTGTSFNNFASPLFSNNTIWTNNFMNRSPGALAWDTSGCIWTPNYSAIGTLSCVDTTGASTDVVSGLGHIQSVALDSAEDVYIAVADEVLLVDTAAGTTTLVHTAGAAILDMVFDPWNDDLYVETTASEIERVQTTGSGVWQTVSGRGRLAITPDGYLVRLVADPVAHGTFEEFALPAY